MHYDRIRNFILKRKMFIVLVGILGLLLVLCVNAFFGNVLKDHMPYIGFLFVEELKSILFGLSIVTAVYCLGLFSITSRLLMFMGMISYEMFLLHGVFLIKYNFFFDDKPLIRKRSINRIFT